MKHGIPVGPTYSKKEIVDAMVEAAINFGVPKSCIRRHATGITMVVRGNLETVACGKGASTQVRSEALQRIAELTGTALAAGAPQACREGEQ